MQGVHRLSVIVEPSNRHILILDSLRHNFNLDLAVDEQTVAPREFGEVERQPGVGRGGDVDVAGCEEHWRNEQHDVSKGQKQRSQESRDVRSRTHLSGWPRKPLMALENPRRRGRKPASQPRGPAPPQPPNPPSPPSKESRDEGRAPA